MNDIKMLTESAIGEDFVPERFLAPGETEYRIRDEQLRAMGHEPSSYRKLKPYEIEALVRNANTCRDWNELRVSEPFTPELVKNCAFAGLVRLGKLERAVLEHHDVRVPVGLYNSRLVACDVGDNCAVLDCSYLAHYIVGDSCILINNHEMECSNHAKFGNGLVMEGESEEVRIELDLMNEAGGRSVLPFDGMLCADAYLWARNRQDAALMAAFRRMTEAMFDRRRGRYGTVGSGSVLKSNHIIKDVAIGPCAYIKGANKLKNLTINSSEEARTQIGEGVELVNGVIARGCRVFYGCKAVRFVMGENSALKYGARLIHSVLGENSTVSCCEILNNLIFPAHEQHHNTSFLIAALVRGQSNMAAGATIGSNHNSRAPDGEIEAGRGFWPGLCSSVKHSSRFASYTLLAKGDYRSEIDLRLPFCLVDDDRTRDRLVLVPAYWWTHNLYALMRNESKFLARDKRREKELLLEQSPFAPDTAEEMIEAIGLLEAWLGRRLRRDACGDSADCAPEELRALGRAALADPAALPPAEIEAEGVENAARPTVVVKPARAVKAYREMLLWYAAGTLAAWAAERPEEERSFARLAAALGRAAPETAARPQGDSAPPARASRWENLGGQLVPAPAVEALLARAASGALPDWRAMHAEYRALAASYPLDKARHAWDVLGWLRGAAPTAESLRADFEDLSRLSRRVEEEIYRSRKKDFDNPFRRATFRSEAEMEAVHGRPEQNSFVLKTRKELGALRARLAELVAAL